TEMVGGDPGRKEAYAYVHFAGDRGIVAARNPVVQPQKLWVKLAPEMGLNPDAASLVVERVYPDHWVSPELAGAGTEIEIPLQGYETAVYEIYPLESAHLPLLGGATYDVTQIGPKAFDFSIYSLEKDGRWLNPETIDTEKSKSAFSIANRIISAESLSSETPKTGSLKKVVKKHRTLIEGELTVGESFTAGKLAVLLTAASPSVGDSLPGMAAKIDGKTAAAKIAKQKGRWKWLTCDVQPGNMPFEVRLSANKRQAPWSGTVSVWLIGTRQAHSQKLSVWAAHPVSKMRPMPPRPWPAGVFQTTTKLGEEKVHLR
ncbi:MAG: hypothetical protein GWP10_10490, partial [Nitrospiraceae bacterium]|nr:hypothetical protein [Nitrospiraceae bacterium]